MKRMDPKAGLAVAIFAVGSLASLGLVAITPKTEQIVRAMPSQLIETLALEPRSASIRIHSQGSVEPRIEAELVAEVAGRITSVSSVLREGGHFSTGDLLFEIDPADYALLVERAEAAHQRADSELELATSTLSRRSHLAERGAASEAALEEARSRASVARAAVREADVALAQAQRDLERTRVTAPFDGRLRERFVDAGQFVSRSHRLARVYGTRSAEVRLPIADADAVALGLHEFERSAADETRRPGPEVVFRRAVGEREFRYRGRLIGSDGAIDPRTRMIQAIATIDDPYQLHGDAVSDASTESTPPLSVGSFVRAEIIGGIVEDVRVVPRAALLDGRLAVVDAGDRVRYREVVTLRTQGREAWVRGAFESGDRLPASKLAVAVDGVQVRTRDTVSAKP